LERKLKSNSLQDAIFIHGGAPLRVSSLVQLPDRKNRADK
jgi:hypothetical protein